MEARDVLEIVGLLDRASVQSRIEGGWGVDALLGFQNRDHGDLDLVIDQLDAGRGRHALEAAGFSVIYEDGPGHITFADARGREVDINVVTADRYGDRWNLSRRVGHGEPDYPIDCFSYGWVAGQKVNCLGPHTQVVHHLGYETEDVDLFDMELLRERFDLSLPDALRQHDLL